MNRILGKFLWKLFDPLRTWKEAEEVDSNPPQSLAAKRCLSSLGNWALSVEPNELSTSPLIPPVPSPLITSNGGCKGRRRKIPHSRKKKGWCPSNKDRKRHDLFIGNLFRGIRGLPLKMINSFGQKYYYKSKLIGKCVICYFEVFNRIYRPIFSQNPPNPFELFLDFIVWKQEEKRVNEILNFMHEEGKVTDTYVRRFNKMLKMRNKTTKKTFVYFYKHNQCFRAIFDWMHAQIDQNMPELNFQAFNQHLLQSL